MTIDPALRPWIDGIETGSVGIEPRDPFPQVPDAVTKVVIRAEEGGPA